MLYDHILADGYKRFLASIPETSEQPIRCDLSLFIDVVCRWCNVHVLFKYSILRNDHRAEITMDAHSLLDNVLVE